MRVLAPLAGLGFVVLVAAASCGSDEGESWMECRTDNNKCPPASGACTTGPR